MNCLLLLTILLCCGGKNNECFRRDICRNSNGCSCRDICGNVCKRDNYDVREEYGKCSEKKEREHTCNRDNHFSHIPPSTSGTHFPYLDVEPRTCGCEAEENS